MEFENLEELAEVMRVLGKVERLRILALLRRRPMYVSEIARMLGMPYPLVHLHLKAMERVGLVESRYEMVTGARPHVRRYYRARDFRIVITPDLIARLAGGEGGEG